VADDVFYTDPGTGTRIGFDERTIAAQPTKIQRQAGIGTTSYAIAQTGAEATGVVRVAARETRRGVKIINRSTANIWVGTGGAFLNPSGGILFKPGDSDYWETTAGITNVTAGESIAASTTGGMHFIEFYDT
jgi:hypothetical protein